MILDVVLAPLALAALTSDMHLCGLLHSAKRDVSCCAWCGRREIDRYVNPAMLWSKCEMGT